MNVVHIFVANSKINYNDEEARLNALFDQPSSETEPPPGSIVDSLTSTLAEKSQTYSSTSEKGTTVSVYSAHVFICVVIL